MKKIALFASAAFAALMVAGAAQAANPQPVINVNLALSDSQQSVDAKLNQTSLSGAASIGDIKGNNAALDASSVNVGNALDVTQKVSGLDPLAQYNGQGAIALVDQTTSAPVTQFSAAVAGTGNIVGNGASLSSISENAGNAASVAQTIH